MSFPLLAARQTTDVLLIEFPSLGLDAADPALIQTLGFALQRAGYQLLELDTREIGVLIVPAGTQGQTFGFRFTTMSQAVQVTFGNYWIKIDNCSIPRSKCSIGTTLTIAVANLPAWSACSRSTLRRR
jgi:hypothetical protein